MEFLLKTAGSDVTIALSTGLDIIVTGQASGVARCCFI